MIFGCTVIYIVYIPKIKYIYVCSGATRVPEQGWAHDNFGIKKYTKNTVKEVHPINPPRKIISADLRKSYD